jgi:enterochelin esterase-like enzyme
LTPTATSIPTGTPTRDVIPSFLIAPVDAPYREEPPATVDCGENGFVFRSRFPSNVYGPTRPYHVYLPPCYGQDGRTYPVLYLIHGSVQTDSHWLDLGLAEHADAGIAEGRYPPFIAIMPFSDELGNLSSGGEKSIEGITVDALLPYVEGHYCAWAEAPGRSIGGISRGGYWALMIAFLHPDKFGAVSGHSSHLRYETDPAQYNPLSTYAAADLADMRIWLDWGERDFLRTGQAQLRDALTAAGIEHEAFINNGGHSDRYWRIHLGEYLDWHAAAWPRDRQDYPLCTRAKPATLRDVIPGTWPWRA